MFNNKIKKAFTMAEVLITLIIIGTIAAVTIPGLKKHASLEENVASLKKAYSTLSSATKIVETHHGDMKRWGNLTSNQEETTTEEEKETPQGLNSALNYYAKAMNSILTCKSNEEGCWTQTKDLQGSTYGGAKNISQNGVGLKTADGMNWSFSGTDNPAAYGVQNSTTNSILVWVDTNGEKKPNMLGMDVFAFIIHPDDGVVPAGAANQSANCTETTKGTDCTAKVIRTGKIDY